MKKVLPIMFFLLGLICLGAEEDAKGKIVPIPLVFSGPDTGFGGGVIAVAYKKNNDFEKLNFYNLGAILTQKGQVSFVGGMDQYLAGGKYKRQVGININKGSDNYYGIGQQSLYENKDKYEKNIFEFSFKLSRRISEKTLVGPIFEYLYCEVEDLKEYENKNHSLKNGGIKAAGIGIKLEYDSTEKIVNQVEGIFSELSFVNYNKNLGSDKEFNIAKFDFRKYQNIFKNTLAFQTVYINQSGDVPFYKIGGYGGSIIRGYNENRYIDKNTLAAQIEYRFNLNKKFKGAVFAGAGEVFPNLDEFKIDKIKKAYGFGLRYVIDEKSGINFRLDFAFNEQDGEEEKMVTYFSIMDAF